jgi:hypothetical protein
MIDFAVLLCSQRYPLVTTFHDVSLQNRRAILSFRDYSKCREVGLARFPSFLGRHRYLLDRTGIPSDLVVQALGFVLSQRHGAEVIRWPGARKSEVEDGLAKAANRGVREVQGHGQSEH